MSEDNSGKDLTNSADANTFSAVISAHFSDGVVDERKFLIQSTKTAGWVRISDWRFDSFDTSYANKSPCIWRLSIEEGAKTWDITVSSDDVLNVDNDAFLALYNDTTTYPNQIPNAVVQPLILKATTSANEKEEKKEDQ